MNRLTQPCTARAHRSAAWRCLVVMLLSVWAVTARAQAVPEHEVRAALLYNFAKFTDWPSDRVLPTAPLEFCSVDAPVAEALRLTLTGRSIGQHPVVVTRVKADDVLRGCAVVYAGTLDTKARGQLLTTLRGTHVLSVGTSSKFIEEGGIVRLFLDDGQMRFAINVDAADRAKLRLSSQLLALARIVKDGAE